MLRPLLLCATLAAALAAGGCPGSNAGVGASCDSGSDCSDELQCLEGICVPLCARAPDCGDGYACAENGLCVAGVGESGDRCRSEVECQPGLACVLDESAGSDGVLDASCTPDRDGHAFGALCESDDECRNGTCGLGRCIDVCRIDRDCAIDHECTDIPRIDPEPPEGEDESIGMFKGCLPVGGSIVFSIPVDKPQDVVYVPVPGNAHSAVLVMTVEDKSQLVGATSLVSPDPDDPTIEGNTLYETPETLEEYYNLWAVRHTPAPAISTLSFPSSDRDPQFLPGPYRLSVSSFRAPGQSGSATPRVKAIIKLGDGTVLDLHFNFLDLSNHPCSQAMGGSLTSAAAAVPTSDFQTVFIAELRLIFARAGVALGEITLDDIQGRPDLDGLEASDLPSLLSLSTRAGGVNVFFVRTLSPVGLQALVGANPGDPQVGSPAGGVAVSIDTLCYRGWTDLARVTAHGIARHMGLFRNIEPPHPDGTFQDPIGDSDVSTDNLMHYSEFGGSNLSATQRVILRESAVLR